MLKAIHLGEVESPTQISPLTPQVMGIKGTPATTKQDGSKLRIGVVHARWNDTIIQALLQGAIDQLKESGVLQENIVVQSVPGSFELPFACSRYILVSCVLID